MNKTFSKYPYFSIKDIILLPLLALIVCSCSGGQKTDAAGKSTPLNVGLAVAEGQLPLPEVPTTLVDIKERATYVVTHFWDGMDFADTVRSHNRGFIEQNFANYLSIFSLVDREQLLRSVTHLMISTEADSEAFRLMADVAEKYLYEPDSPMLDEENYELFLPAIISSGVIDKPTKEHYIFQQECIHKNRRGSIAADFSYSDARGRLHTLWTTDAADRLLLMFFDPECDHCKEIMTNIEASCELTKQIDAGALSIMAICAAGDKSRWLDVKNNLPSSWIVGLDKSDIDSKQIYVLRDMPTIYVLDSDKRVVLKDAHVDTAMDYLIEGYNSSQQV